MTAVFQIHQLGHGISLSKLNSSATPLWKTRHPELLTVSFVTPTNGDSTSSVLQVR